MNPQFSNLFDFADFRKFLEDYQARRQAVEPDFTRSRFCRELGMPRTRSYVNDIIKGSKPLTRTYVDRFVRVLRMDSDEARYFRVLVDFNQSLQEGERELLFDQLVALNRTPRRLVDPSQYEFYRRWYHSTVLALMDVHDFRGDHADLARRVYPHITPGQARDSVALLKRLKLIRRNGRGAWEPADKTLDTGRVRNELVKQYQLQCLELAKKIMLLENDPPRVRSFSTATLRVSESGSRLIEKKLQKFRAEIRAIAHRETAAADRVYQLNVQYFPQSSQEHEA
jgi:uncharacterized protein (TIGR02147 family)